MAGNTDRVLVGADSELWIDGVDLRESATQIAVGPQHVTRDSTRLQSDLTRTQPVMLTGNMEVQMLADETDTAEQIGRLWLSAIRGGYVAPVMWADQEGFRVGQICSATYITPQTAPRTAGAQDLVRRSYGGSWHAAEAQGLLRSGQTAAGRNPLGSAMDSDYALADINTRGPDIYTDTVAVDRGAGSVVAVCAQVRDVVGHPGTPPALSFAAPPEWQHLYIPDAAGGQIIHITHKGVTRGVPLTRNDQVLTVQEHLGELRWPDGFSVTVTLAANTFTITGSAAGADEDIVLPNTNIAPWRGSARGTGNDTDVRLVSATGTGGGRTYQPLTGWADCDAHHVPVVLQAIAEDGLEQIGLQFRVPAAAQNYNYQMRYSLGYLVDGILE